MQCIYICILSIFSSSPHFIPNNLAGSSSEAQLAPRSFRQMLRNSADTLEEVPALLVRLGPGFPLGFWGEWKGRVVDVFFFFQTKFSVRKGGVGVWSLEWMDFSIY